jgi:hypothetical protein
MTDEARVTRDPPARNGALRSQDAMAAAAAPAPADPTAARPAPPGDETVSEAVARAVRLGYDVIGKNIEEGRIAAERFRTGQYSIRDAPADLGTLSLRLLGLTRELSATTFEVLERLLRDPAVVRALQPRRDVAAGPPAATGTQASGGGGAADAAKAEAPADVLLTCTFEGSQKAKDRVKVKAATLTRPRTPAMLSVAGLARLDKSVPPITDVTFSPASDGYGVVAKIGLKDDQPPGVYSGVVCAADSELPLGLLTIEITG